jgi:tungstate transport system substrate-binding protein
MTRSRRLLLGAAAALLAWPAVLRAQQTRSLKDPMRLGADQALMESGLAMALQRAFGRDTGVAVQLIGGRALPLLDTLERGEIDAALANAPEAEQKLDKQGLVHDRQRIADTSLVLVGPAPKKKIPDPAGIARLTDVVQALQQLRDAALATPGSITFLTAGDGSGSHAAEQALWRAAQLAPAAPWYAKASADASLAQQARRQGAYALIERGAWLAQAGAPLAVLVEGDARMAMPVHVMRSFRVNHPAGKLFTAWITGPKGRAVIAAHRGYRAPA